MKELRDIIRDYDEIDKSKTKLALATVYEVKGSSYRRTGARMLIQDNGRWTGGISGGCIEGNALKKANLTMVDGQARLITYDTENDDEASIGVSLGCNGIISIIITAINAENNPIEKIRTILDSRKPEVLITVLKSSTNSFKEGSILSYDELTGGSADPLLVEKLRKAAQGALSELKSKTLDSAGDSFFIELIQPDIRLLVLGGNYDTYPLIKLSNGLGWESIVVANPRRVYEGVKDLTVTIIDDFDNIKIDQTTVAVIMSHDYNADLGNLRKALTSQLNYIGLLGPAVRRNDMLNELRSEGLEFDETRIYGPAGLDIGANQPEEIAVAIISEIIAVQRGRKAQPLRERLTSIYER